MQRYLVLDYPPTRVIGDVTAGSALQAARIADEDNDALGFEYDVQDRALAGHLPVACFVARRRMALALGHPN